MVNPAGFGSFPSGPAYGTTPDVVLGSRSVRDIYDKVGAPKVRPGRLNSLCFHILPPVSFSHQSDVISVFAHGVPTCRHSPHLPPAPLLYMVRCHPSVCSWCAFTRLSHLPSPSLLSPPFKPRYVCSKSLVVRLIFQPSLTQPFTRGYAPAPRAPASRQGLTLVHLSAQLEPCLSQENTLHTLNTP